MALQICTSGVQEVTPIELDTELSVSSTNGISNKAVTEALLNRYTKAEIEDYIAAELEKFDKLDFKIADSIPTTTTVVINDEEVETIEGVRYLVKHTTDDMYEEYIFVNGVIYNIGSTSDINLDGYATKSWVNSRLDGIEVIQELLENADIQLMEQKINAAITDAKKSVNEVKGQYEVEYTKLKTDTKKELNQLKEDTIDDLEVFKDGIESDIATFKENELSAFTTWFEDKRQILSEQAVGNLSNIIDDNYLKDFKKHYGLINSETEVWEKEGIKYITQTTDEATINTTITENDGIRTIVENVIPVFGLYNYKKTTVITINNGIKHIEETVEEIGK